MTTIAQEPNSHLIVWKESPRGPNYGPHLFERAGRIQLAERLWPITHRVLAIGFDELVLGNTWWALKTHDLSASQEKALLLWLNSSLAMLMYFGRRVVTRSAWMQMKQPAWQAMPVLDVRQLKRDQLSKLGKLYDKISRKQLAPLAQLNTDAVRIAIDDALCSVLGLPDLKPVREMLCREPGLNAIDINPRQSAEPLDDEEEEDDDQEEMTV